MVKTSVAALIACAVSTSAFADDKKYTMADLEALVGQKSFKEAYLHLGDIAPSARNALTLKVAKLARRSMNAYGAVPFFEEAIAADKSACRDEDAKLAVIAGLGLPEDYDNAKKAKVLMTTCFADMKSDVLKAFDEDADGGYTQRASCDALTKARMLSSAQQKNCSKKK